MMRSDINILLMIAARAGSQGVKNKNFKNFYEEKSLFQIALDNLAATNLSDYIYVNSDKLNIRNSTKNKIVKIIKRPNKLSSSNISKFCVWQHTLNYLENTNNIKYDYLIDLDCTNPLIKKSDILNSFKVLLQNNNFDGVIPISVSRKNPYFNILELKKKKLVISGKSDKIFHSRQRTPKTYDHIAGPYIFKTKYLRSSTSLFEGKILGYELKDFQSFDIDTTFDFQLMQHLYQKYIVKKI